MDIGALTVFLYCFREREAAAAHLRGRQRPAHDDQLHPHRRRQRWNRPRTSTTRFATFLLDFPSQDRRVRRTCCTEQSHLDRPAQGRRLHLSGGCHRARRHRASAARRGHRLRPAPRHALLRLREVPVQGADLHDRRRLGALRRPHGGDARVGEDLPAGAGRHASRAASSPTRRRSSCPTASR